MTMSHVHRSERGQMLILFVGIFTIIMVIGAIAVDFGIWFSERRGAQKDADLSALAGAYELLQQDFVLGGVDETIRAAAEQAAYDWADKNDLPPEDVHNLVVDNTSCYGTSSVLDSVSLDAEHHSRALFASAFGVVSGQIGAHGRACLGSIVSAEGLLPVGVQISGDGSDCWEDQNGDGIEDPKFGVQCTLAFGAGETTSGESGSLRLYDDGSLSCSGQVQGGGNTYTDQLSSGGADTTCYVLPPGETCDSYPQGCVYPLTGVGANPQRRAIEELISTEGACDAAYGDGDGIDEFLEVVEAFNGDPTPSQGTVFVEHDCESPRLVSLIIVEQFAEQGNPPMPIRAFASFLIEGCELDGDIRPKCDFSGSSGQIILVGRFLNILVTNGDIGAINTWSPKKIGLVE